MKRVSTNNIPKRIACSPPASTHEYLRCSLSHEGTDRRQAQNRLKPWQVEVPVTAFIIPFLEQCRRLKGHCGVLRCVHESGRPIKRHRYLPPPACDSGFFDEGGWGSSQFWRGSETLATRNQLKMRNCITYSQCEMPIVLIRLFHVLLHLRRRWVPIP